MSTAVNDLRMAAGDGAGPEQEPGRFSSFALGGAVVFVGVVALVARLFVMFYTDVVFDDAYITMRVARNLSEGHGAVYNVGDRVQASTSILYTLLCAFSWKIMGANTIAAARMASCIVDAMTAAGLTWLCAVAAATRIEPRLAVAAAFVGGCFYATVSTCTMMVSGGLETAFACAAIACACWAVGRGRFVPAAAVGSVCCLLRPDGALVLLIVLGFATRARQLFKPALVAVAVLVPCLALQFIYYGTIIPQTVTAKSLVARSAVEQWQLLLNKFFWGDPIRVSLGALMLLGIYRGLRIRAIAPLLTWGVLYAFVFSSFGMWWPWYWPPLVMALALALGIGAGEVAGWVCAHRVSIRMAEVAVFCVGVCLVGVLSLKSYRAADALRDMKPLATRQRVGLARWLNANTAEDANVLVEPMGEIGFHTSRRVDDYPGLASRRVTAALRTLGRRVGGNPMDVEALQAVVRQVLPAYLILRENEFRSAAHVLEGYALVHVARQSESMTARAPDQQSMYVLRRTRDSLALH